MRSYRYVAMNLKRRIRNLCMETNQTEGLGRVSGVKKNERGLLGIFLLQTATSVRRSGSASTNPYILPSVLYSRRDALDSYRGN